MSPTEVLFFLIGDISSAPLSAAMATLGSVMLMVFIYETLSTPNHKEGAAAVGKRLLAYLVFIIAAHRLDELAADAMFGWKGSTQYLICIGLSVTEGLPFLRRIAQWAKVAPPEVLVNRLSQMERGQVSAEYIDGRELDLKIQNLKENMEKLKEYERLKREAQGLTQVQPDGMPSLSDSGEAPVQSNTPTI